jgi:hypothetical protein
MDPEKPTHAQREAACLWAGEPPSKGQASPIKRIFLCSRRRGCSISVRVAGSGCPEGIPTKWLTGNAGSQNPTARTAAPSHRDRHESRRRPPHLTPRNVLPSDETCAAYFNHDSCGRWHAPRHRFGRTPLHTSRAEKQVCFCLSSPDASHSESQPSTSGGERAEEELARHSISNRVEPSPPTV